MGTTAVLQSSVKIKKIGLLVIDEEQRFGVGQKEHLKAISSGVDVLTLSATPIPRTLQMAMSGLKDFSQMNSPPKGRKEVQVYVGATDYAVLKKAIEAEVNRGGQVFVVVPFISEITPVHEKIREVLPQITVLEAHGQLASLEERILAFTQRQGDVLLSTAVIENGIDMPNVNTIIVLNADKFGMSALYQLRGRVGRSSKQAYAYFMTNMTSVTVESESRLIYIKTFTALGSGYELSRRDMEMRGYGTIFGKDQSGSKDVGIDLQTSILNQALKDIEMELIIPIPECRVQFALDIEGFGESNCGAMPGPRAGTLAENAQETIEWLSLQSEVTRWETDMAQKVIDLYFGPPKRGKTLASVDDERADNGNNYESNAAAVATIKIEKAKVFPRSRKVAAQALNDILAATTLTSLVSVRHKWESLFISADMVFPDELQELINRFQTRLLCRQFGVEVATREGSDAVFYSKNINFKKWRELNKGVPGQLRDRVFFSMLDRNVTNNIGVNVQDISIGRVMLKQTFSEEVNKTPQELLHFMEALAIQAETNLNEAFSKFDPIAAEVEEREKNKEETKITKKLLKSMQTTINAHGL